MTTPLALVALCVAPTLTPRAVAQAAPAATNGSATNGDETVILSPFVVSASEDSGYSATSTLAGTRVRTDLKDVSSSISVVTQKFLQDTGAKKNEDLLVYTPSTEVGGVRGNFSGAGGSSTYDERPNLLRPSQNTRVRGLDAADNTRDYFLTEIPWDGYNVGRVDLQRGPNSILFGVGSPAGIINTSLNAAAFKSAYVVESRVDDRGSFRESVDLNQVIKKNELAVRFAALDDETHYEQKPAFNHDQRVYLAVRYDPQLFKNGQTSIRGNFERGRVSANRPRDLPPIDRLTAWFKPVPPAGSSDFGMGKSTYIPTQQFTQYITNSSIFSNTFMGRLYAADVAMYYNANQSTPSALSALGAGTSAMQAYMNNAIIDANGRLLGGSVNGALIGRYFAVPSLNQWATTGTAAVPGGANYGDVSLKDPSIFNFYKNLLDGDNKREWQNWKAGNIAASQTFFNNRLGFEFVYDQQRYRDGQFNLLGAPEYAISVDINQTMIDGSANPNLGRPYVAASGQNGGNQTFIDRDSLRFTAFGEVRASDYLGKTTFAKIVGRHLFTGLISQDDKTTDNRAFLRFATDPSFGVATGQGIQGLNNAARYVDWVAYLGNTNFLNASSAAGANLPRITGTISPIGSQTVRYFSPVWSATGVDPAAPFTYTTYNGSGQAVQTTGTQADNPANYVGWTTRSVNVLNADKGDLEQLYTSGTANKNRVKSYGITWQGYFWDDTLVTTVGWREDSVRHNAAAAPVDSQGVAVMNYNYDPANSQTTVGHSLSWGGVFHLKMLDKYLPGGTKIGVLFNHGENFKADAPRGDVFGYAIPNPSAKTKEYGVAVSTLDDRISMRLTRFETSQKNATLSGATGGGFAGNAYLFWAAPYWSATEALAALDGIAAPTSQGGLGYNVPNIPPAYINNNWYSWQGIATNPDGSPNGAQIFKVVSDFFQNFPLSQYTVDQYGLQLNVAKMHSTNPADWYAAVGAATPGNQNLGAQPLYAGTLKSFGAGPSASVDTVSKGWEFEATAHATKNWDLTFNASQTDAVRNALNPTMATAMKTMTDFFNTDAGLIRWWGGPTFRDQWNNNLTTAYKALIAQQGSQAAEVPKWRANLISTVHFDNGAVRGTYVGGAFRWEDRRILGYKYNATAGTIDVGSPFYGPTESHVDLWLGYSRQLTKQVNWRVQLNVRNLAEDTRLIPVSVNPDGRVALARIQEGTGFQLTNTFTF